LSQYASVGPAILAPEMSMFFVVIMVFPAFLSSIFCLTVQRVLHPSVTRIQNAQGDGTLSPGERRMVVKKDVGEKRSDELEATCHLAGLQAVMDTKLAIEIAHMILDGVNRDD
jgi:hypothetical protein